MMRDPGCRRPACPARRSKRRSTTRSAAPAANSDDHTFAEPAERQHLCVPWPAASAGTDCHLDADGVMQLQEECSCGRIVVSLVVVTRARCCIEVVHACVTG